MWWRLISTSHIWSGLTFRTWKCDLFDDPLDTLGPGCRFWYRLTQNPH
jgi:hypothetical protein